MSRSDGGALSRCIGIPVPEFADRYWGRQALLSAGGADAFADLFSIDAVDELLADRALRTPFIRMAKEGEVLPSAQYTSSGGYGAEIADQVDSAAVLAEFAAGSTIVLQGLHRTWAPLAAFTRELVRELGHPVQVNAYVTPASSRGFDPHYDVHDVFVLQIAGAKRWVVHAPVHELPFADEPWSQHAVAVAERAAGPATIETDLSPGDALYLPRGWIHSATALSGTTVHLTIGVPAFTRADLAKELLADALRAPGLRTSLPLGIRLDDPAELRDDADAAADAIRTALGTDRSSIGAALATRFDAMTRAEPVRPVATVELLAGLDPALVVRWRDALPGTVTVEGDQVLVRLRDRAIRFPGQCAKALEALRAGAANAAGALPGLDEPDSLTVTRRLLREAVVVPEPNP